MKLSRLFVLDCSVTITWLLPDEKMNMKADAILASLSHQQAKVPNLWSLEVANVLWQCERLGKITALEVAEFKDFLSTLPIHIDNSTTTRAMGSIYEIAKSEQLTVYDASYLEVAIRENIALATFDKALRKSATKFKVPLL